MGVGGSDHAAEGMADDVDPLMPEPGPQGFKVFDQLPEAVGNRRRRACAMAAEIEAHAGELVAERGDDGIPRHRARADAVHHVERRPLALDPIGDFYCGYAHYPPTAIGTHFMA